MTATRCDHDIERIVAALAEADEPLTAQEILAYLRERGLDLESSHQVATVLGRAAHTGAVEVVQTSPYEYRVTEEA